MQQAPASEYRLADFSQQQVKRIFAFSAVYESNIATMTPDRNARPIDADDPVIVSEHTTQANTLRDAGRTTERTPQAKHRPRTGDDEDYVDELHEILEDTAQKHHDTRLRKRVQQTALQPNDPPAQIRSGRPRKFKDPEVLYKIIDGLDAKISHLNLRIQDGEDRRKAEQEKLATSKQQVKDKRNETGELQTKIQSLKLELKEAKEKISQLEEKLTQQSKEIREFQEETFAKLDEKNLAVDTDDKVTAQLDKLLRSVRAWSNKYAIDNWQHSETQFVNLLLDDLKQAGSPEVIGSRGAKAILKGLLPPRILLNTVVNRELVAFTVGRPFRLVAGVKTGRDDLRSCIMLEGMHEELLKGEASPPCTVVH